MKKRIPSILLSVVLCFGLISAASANTTLNTEDGHSRLEYEDPNPTPPPPGSVEEPIEEPVISPFTDVKPGDYCYDAVLWAVEKGISGGSGTTFGPDTNCTRAETMTILWRAAGSPKPRNSSSPFRDVVTGDYFYDAVLWAVEQGITTGTSADEFSPSEIVSRGQIVTFLYRAMKAQPAGSGNPFADVAANAYYAGPVQWAVSRGITNGTSPITFSPNQICTRGQIVTFLYRAETES